MSYTYLTRDDRISLSALLKEGLNLFLSIFYCRKTSKMILLLMKKQ